jgi:hypothetical protein
LQTRFDWALCSQNNFGIRAQDKILLSVGPQEFVFLRAWLEKFLPVPAVDPVQQADDANDGSDRDQDEYDDPEVAEVLAKMATFSPEQKKKVEEFVPTCTSHFSINLTLHSKLMYELP